MQGIGYEAILDQSKQSELKNTSAGQRDNETFEQYLARALKDN